MIRGAWTLPLKRVIASFHLSSLLLFSLAFAAAVAECAENELAETLADDAPGVAETTPHNNLTYL